MSWSTSELGVRLAPLSQFKPSSKIFYWPFQGGASFVGLLCFCSVLCLLCLCSRLFVCALWSPAGKGLTSWFSFVVSTMSLSLSNWYPGSGVVLDCIDSWSLHPYLLCCIKQQRHESAFAYVQSDQWLVIKYLESKVNGLCKITRLLLGKYSYPKPPVKWHTSKLIKSFLKQKRMSRHEILVLIALLGNKTTDEPSQIPRLATAFANYIHKMYKYM